MVIQAFPKNERFLESGNESKNVARLGSAKSYPEVVAFSDKKAVLLDFAECLQHVIQESSSVSIFKHFSKK